MKRKSKEVKIKKKKKRNSIHLSKCNACGHVHTCTLAMNCFSNLQRLKSSPLHLLAFFTFPFIHPSIHSFIHTYKTSIIAINIYVSSSQWATSERKWNLFSCSPSIFLSLNFSLVFFCTQNSVGEKVKRFKYIFVICST